ncbi:MAG: DUF4265 domain-containing protein [Bacteroidota bacterium]
MSEDILCKIYIDLPNHWAAGGESLWAESLGDDLYKVENIPFFAYGLNFHDIVLATSDSPELKPEVHKVVKQSGHRTLRVSFKEHINGDQQEEYLNSMTNFSISYERANSIYFALDIESEGSYNDVYDRLDELQKQEVLEFETCEARVEGSFDSVLEEEDSK